MRYVKFLLLTVIMLMVFTGCTSFSDENNTVADADGKMLRYKITDLSNGFYVKNKDDTFSPVFGGMANYSENNGTSFLKEGDSDDRYIWFADNGNIKFKNLVPVVNSKTPLVGFFDGNGSFPESIVLEKFDPLGYTVGCTFKMAEDQTTIVLESDNTCPNSTAAEYVQRGGLSGEYEVVKFNESKDVPINNVDTSTGLLLGLEKNKRYQIGYYDGTIYRSTTVDDFSLRADTRIFRSMGNTTLDIPFDRTTDNYFIINLPDNLEAGYYYINEFGLFEYRP